MEEIIGHSRVVRSVHILPRTGDQFNLDVEFYTEMYVGITISRHKKLHIILIHGGDPYTRGLNSPEYRRLKGCVREDVKLATYRRYLLVRHDVPE